ncbi:acyloxyacyl hydrolase [Roseococcus pinisoli]|uniref:Acyloxyacyl hydrolase n=1 Tax=Roseococcus pinisoli TaxID=2835040 RepID=A0ABS5QGL2_9PROT|nr:acyloxyacyl hydrolase [Roseococcus pinisoli]
MGFPLPAFPPAAWRWASRLSLVTFLALSPAMARSQEVLPRMHAGLTVETWLSELRGGLTWHDPSFLNGRESGLDINGELLFVTPVPRSWGEGLSPGWRWLATPRPHLGFTANTSGNTSSGYFGLTWSVPIARDVFRRGDAIRFDFFGGGAVHDGLRYSHVADRKSLGSSLLFRVGGEIGYQFTPRYSVSLFLDHMSNAGLARENQGLNTLGLRFGVGF